jgi:hypothetical protein
VNSLANLNSYSNDFLTFNDERDTTYQFDRTSPDDQTVNVYENQTHSVPVGINITGLFNANAVTYSIDLNNLAGTTATWPNLSGLGTGNLSVESAANVYTVSGIISTIDWEIVKSPVINMGANPPNSWEYDCTINYDETESKTWTVSVQVTQLDQLTSASDYYYNANVADIVLNTPTYYDLGVAEYDDATFTLTVAPSVTTTVSTMSSTGVGGTSTFNGTTKTLTVVGNSTSISTHLGNITLTPTTGNADTYNLIYNLANPDSGFTTVRSQYVRPLDNIYLTEATPIYFDPNTSEVLTGVPVITALTLPVESTYTMTISSTTSGAIDTLSSTGSGGTSSFSNLTKTLTLTGTKAEINSHLANVTYQPGVDFSSDFQMRYALTLPDTNTAVKLQGFFSSGADEVSNLDVIRNLITETPAALFADDVPQITETVSNAVYKLELSSSSGDLGQIYTQSYAPTFTLIGYTKTDLNSLLGTIKFYPNKATSGYQTVNFKLSRRVAPSAYTVIVDANLIVYLAARTEPIPGASTNTFNSSGIFYPTYEQVNYLTPQVILVGGGGAGYGNATPGVGGGSGGLLFETTSASFVNEGGRGLQITVGSGGGVGGGTGGQSKIANYNNTTTYYTVTGGVASDHPNRGANSSPYLGGLGIPTNGVPPIYAGGGGAGRSANGTSATTVTGGYKGGTGGAGQVSSINGVRYGGGGGGWGYATDTTYGAGGGPGGSGGGGKGGTNSSPGLPGTPNTGGGGGGYGGDGGSGIVIIKFV